ncbi:MAG: trypsin-like peptidase domain-containing protein [Planctomycetia bacterium]|nr:trypsin-like peptidase domain-containing protein [Planctomycetia bacterium]
MFDFSSFMTDQIWFANNNLESINWFSYAFILAAFVAVIALLCFLYYLLKKHSVLFCSIVIVCCFMTFFDNLKNVCKSISNDSSIYSISNEAETQASLVSYTEPANQSQDSATEKSQAQTSKPTGTFTEPPYGVKPVINSQQTAPSHPLPPSTPESGQNEKWRNYVDSLNQNSGQHQEYSLDQNQTNNNITSNNGDQPAIYQAPIDTIEESNINKTSLDISKPDPIKSLPNTIAIPVPFDRIPNQSNQSNVVMISNLWSEEMRSACDKVRPSVVHIEARVFYDEKRDLSKIKDETGCGVLVILEQKGYIVTNGHVAGLPVSNDSVDIHLANKQIIHPINVLYCKEFDIALLEIRLNEINVDLTDRNSKVRIAELGNSDRVNFLDCVMSIGSPFGLDGSVSQGYISSQQRRDIVAEGTQNQFQRFIQTNAPANRGNSGGPLFTMNGEIIGIVTAIATHSGVNEGITFAIPVNNIKHVAKQLVKTGVYSRPYIGIELDSNFKPKMNLYQDQKQPGGTQINLVHEKSPASLAGLRRGDIILKYNNIEVENGLHFIQLVALSEINQQAEIIVLRDGQIKVLKPVLAKKS